MITDLLSKDDVDYSYEIGYWQDDLLEGYGKCIQKGNDEATQEGVFSKHELEQSKEKIDKEDQIDFDKYLRKKRK